MPKATLNKPTPSLAGAPHDAANEIRLQPALKNSRESRSRRMSGVYAHAIIESCGPLAQLVRAEDLMGESLHRGGDHGMGRARWVAQGKFTLP